MNNDTFLLMLFVYSAPVVSGLLSIAFLHLGASRTKVSTDRKLRKLLTAYFLTVAVNWIFVNTLLFSPRIVADINGLVYALLLLVQVFVYHFLYVLTATSEDRRFSILHYVFPITIFLLVTGWSLTVPADVRLAAISGPQAAGDARLYDVDINNNASFVYYTALVRSKPGVRLVFNLTYTLLSFRCILRYRKKAADFTADTDSSSLGWLLLFTSLALSLFLPTVLSLVMEPYHALVLFHGAFPALIIFIQIPILCYNTIRHRYVLITQVDSALPDSGTLIITGKIGRQQLEEFMTSAKPYLKTDLKITDLAGPLKTNRNYLSSFINTTYGMNFSQFINGYRLRELDALRADGKYIRLGNLELIYKAGFGSYHAYYRAKKQQDKQKLLPLDE